MSNRYTFTPPPGSPVMTPTGAYGVQKFFNAEFGIIRIICDEFDEPHFCFNDICRVLNMRPCRLVKRLDKNFISKYRVPSSGGAQLTNFVNLDGFDDIIRKHGTLFARHFRKWITGEVLPAIHKNGSVEDAPASLAVATVQMSVFNSAVTYIGITAKQLQDVFYEVQGSHAYLLRYRTRRLGYLLCRTQTRQPHKNHARLCHCRRQDS